jgi:HSP20 family protein
MFPLAKLRRGALDHPADSFWDEYRRLRQSLFSGPDLTGMEELNAYPVDVIENDDELLLEAELPGFKRDEIEVDIEDGRLMIAAERAADESRKEYRHRVTERSLARVERSFALPSTVDVTRAEATLEDGVLLLRLPKTQERKSTRIEIA